MRYRSYLNTAKKIIESYKGATPLPVHLKNFFAADKKYGSKDRKQIAALCYNFYRLGKALKEMPIEERIIISTFLCETKDNAFLKEIRPELNENITSGVADKLSIINYQLSIDTIFPWADELSVGIDAEEYAASFLQQPDLFLRIRPGKENIVQQKLTDAHISFEIENECITLANTTKLDSILEINKEVIIQDKNSQKVLDFFRSDIKDPRSEITLWDCCAASGGKSLLLYDILQGKVALAVSDIRESILFNLKKRFQAAGIKHYRSFIADLTNKCLTIPIEPPSIIICDAPCTGSGTWGRSPEQLFYFDKKQIDVYAKRQQQIVSNVIPHLQKNGFFVYITCSVFKKENEDIVKFIENNFEVRQLEMKVLKGCNEKADSMFVAIFEHKI